MMHALENPPIRSEAKNFTVIVLVQYARQYARKPVPNAVSWEVPLENPPTRQVKPKISPS
jgi:hypothetical protein